MKIEKIQHVQSTNKSYLVGVPFSYLVATSNSATHIQKAKPTDLERFTGK